MDRRGAAFLDFDHTVIHGDMGPMFGNYLAARRFEEVRWRDGRRAALREQAKTIVRYTPYLVSLGLQVGLYKTRALRRSSLVRTAYRALRGVPAAEYYQHMDSFVRAEIPQRIYPSVRQEMKEHRVLGRDVVIITTGIEELVKRCLPHLPDGVQVIGCKLAERNGILTGKVDGPLYGAHKASIIKDYCSRHDANLEKSWAYTDHFSDHQMLQAVGNGVCINPKKRLAKLAQRNGWQIMRLPSPIS